MKGEGKSGVRAHEVPSSASKRAEMGVGIQSQGLLPPEKEAEMTEGFEPGWSRVMDDEALQRALEQEVVAQLHQENTDLKRALAELQEAKANAGSTTSSWSEVTPPPPPYEHGSPRASGWKLNQGGADNRFTPGGTKVPEGPPPPDEPLIAMPPWPVSCLYYEKDVRRFPCANTLGMVGADKVTANLNQRALHPPVCRGGMDSRMDLSAGDCRGGMDSRHELHGQERRAEKRSREELDQDNQGFRDDVLHKRRLCGWKESCRTCINYWVLQHIQASRSRAIGTRTEEQEENRKWLYVAKVLEYAIKIGLMPALLKYVITVGLSSKVKIVKTIGHCSEIDFTAKFGLLSMMDFLTEFGLRSKMDFVKEVGLQRETEFAMTIGLMSSMDFVEMDRLWNRGNTQEEVPTEKTKIRRYHKETMEETLDREGSWTCPS